MLDKHVAKSSYIPLRSRPSKMKKLCENHPGNALKPGHSQAQVSPHTSARQTLDPKIPS